MRETKQRQSAEFAAAAALIVSAIACATGPSVAATGSPSAPGTVQPEVSATTSVEGTPNATGTLPTGEPTAEGTAVGTAAAGPAGTDEGPVAAKAIGILSLQVETLDGQPGGVVQDILLDLKTGEVAYLVVLSGGSMATGGLIAVPRDFVADIRVEDLVVVLTVDAITLSEAPALPLDELPELVTDPNWDAAMRAYWSAFTAPP